MRWLLPLTLFVSICCAANSVNYYYGEYEQGREERKSVFFEALFDNDLKLSYADSSFRCGSSANTAILQPCAACINPNDPPCLSSCLDSSSPSVTISTPVNSTIGLGTGFSSFYFILAANTCEAAFISVTPISGVVYLDAWTGDSTAPTYIGSVSNGSLVICCKNVVLNSNNEFMVHVNVMGLLHGNPTLNATVNVTLFTDPNNLPVTSFLDLVEPVVNFGGFSTLTCSQRPYACFRAPFATANTGYDYNSRISSTVPISFETNKLFFEIIAVRTFGTTSSTSLVQEVSWDALGFDSDPATITVTFANIQTLQSQAFTANQISLTCDYSNTKAADIEPSRKGFDAVDTIATAVSVPGRFGDTFYSTVVGWQIRRFSATFESKGWLGCKYYIENTLGFSKIVGNVTVFSYSCPSVDLTRKCCKPTPQSVNLYESQSRDDNTLRQYCPASGLSCAKTTINSYFKAAASADSCSSAQALVADTTLSIYRNCINHLTPKNCSSDVECAAAFPRQGGVCKTRPGVSVYQSAARIKRTRLGAGYSGIRVCVPLCSTNADCPYGTCVDRGSWKECLMNSTYLALDMAKSLATCFANTVERISASETFFKTRVAQVLGVPANSPPTTIATVLAQKTSSQSCAPPLLAGRGSTCDEVNRDVCITSFCENPGSSAVFCSPNLTCPQNAAFCGRSLPLSPIIKQEVSQRGECLVFPLITDKQCVNYQTKTNAVTGAYDYVNEYCIYQKTASGNAVDQSVCLDSNYCSTENTFPLESYAGISFRDFAPFPSKGTVCLPICIDRSRVQANCTSPNSWANGRCEVPALTASECGFDWWAGSVWLPPQYDPYSQQECKNKCAYDNNALDQLACTNNFHCTDPRNSILNSETACTSAGYCSMEPGCYFNYSTITDGACDVSYITKKFMTDLGSSSYFGTSTDILNNAIQWTPNGCIVKFEWGLPMNRVTCESRGGRYLSYYDWLKINKTACEAQAKLCYTGSAPVTANYPLQSVWPGYSYDIKPAGGDPNPCATCGGKIVNAYQWIAGKWIQNSDTDWLQLASLNYQPVTLYTQNGTTILEAALISVIGLADSLREMDYTKNRAVCLSEIFTGLPTISCLCQGNQSNATSKDCNCDNSASEICASLTICGSISQGNITCGSSGLSSYILKNESWPSNKCTATQVYQWSADNLFVDADDVPIDSGRIFSTQLRRGELGYVKNSKNIIVGQVVGAGWNMNFPDVSRGEIVPGFQACVSFAGLNTVKRDPSLSLTRRDIGKAVLIYDSNNESTAIGPIEPMGLNLPLTTAQQCIEVQAGYAYFPIELVDNANTLTYPQTIKDPGPAIFAVGIVIYAIGLLALILLVVVDLQKKGGNTTYVKHALVFMGSAFALRIAWIGYILSDPKNERITVLFIELPAMLYWFLASFNLTRWMQPPKNEYDEADCSHACCLPKLKQYVLAVVTITSILFIIMLVFMLGNIGTSVAGNTNLVSGEQQIAEFAWFSFFVTFVFIEIVWFLLAIMCGICGAGLKIFEPSEEGNNTQRGMTGSVILSMVTVILISCAQIILIVRVFLWSPFDGLVWDAPTAIGYTILLDMVPAILLTICCLLSPYRKGTLFQHTDY